MKKQCPVCKSTDTKQHGEEGLTYLQCNKCKFNEAEDWDETYPGQRNTQREKGKQTPYKRGGGQRARK